MGKISTSHDSKTWQRSEWYENTTDPVHEGLYEVKVSSKHPITIQAWENQKWQEKMPSVFSWRGLTKRQYESLPFELFFPPVIEEEEKPVPCYSCGEPHFENDKDLNFWSGQYICPDCGEGWVMAEDRDNLEEDQE